MKEDWTKQMKQKLEGHQMTPPAGLWEGISSEMNLEPKSAPKSAMIRRLYWAAAAAIVAIVGFFAFYQFDEKQPQLVAKHEQPSSEMTEETYLPKTIKIKQQETPKKPKTPEVSTVPEVTEISEVAELAEVAEVTEVTEVPETPEEPKTPEPSDAPVLASTEKKQTYLPDVIEPDVTVSKSDATSKWSLGLNGSNGLLMASNNYAGDMNTFGLSIFYNDAKDNGNTTSSFANELTDYSNAHIQNSTIAKHHLPIRLGLSLQYQLSPNLALNSGISYSYLESDFEMTYGQNSNYTQKLRYVGVPLGVSWKLWEAGGFSLYLTGGTLIEKCVSAYMADEKIETRPWQLSVNASAGAEYNISRQLGLYLEPSLGYYFDDKSSIEHYYKEHPLAPSIQFGLRLHLK